MLQNISKREKKCQEEETTDIPTHLELYKIIQELAHKQVKLEEQIKKLQTKQRKINIIEWLNKNKVPEISFQEWMNNISMNNEFIEYLFENSIVDTINHILYTEIFKDNTYLQNTQTQPPIFSAVQKANMLYMYHDSEKKWQKMSLEEFVILLKTIDKKLFKAMCDWQKENMTKMQKDDYLEIKFNKGMIKLTGVSYNSESQIVSKIRTSMYNKIKEDMCIVEMEFE